jgi:hypothetical protein
VDPVATRLVHFIFNPFCLPGKRECNADQILTVSANVKRCYVMHTDSKVKGKDIDKRCKDLKGKPVVLDTQEKINFLKSRSTGWFK